MEGRQVYSAGKLARQLTLSATRGKVARSRLLRSLGILIPLALLYFTTVNHTDIYDSEKLRALRLVANVTTVDGRSTLVPSRALTPQLFDAGPFSDAVRSLSFQPGRWQQLHHAIRHSNSSLHRPHQIFLRAGNAGFGFGDQLQQIVHTAVWASKHDLVFVNTPLKSDRGTNWPLLLQGLDAGELHAEQLHEHLGYRASRLHHVTISCPECFVSPATLELDIIAATNQCRQMFNDTPAAYDGCIIEVHDAQLPITHEDVVCEVTVNQQLRRKYCKQHVERPMDYFTDDLDVSTPSTLYHVPVAVHYRSGDLSSAAAGRTCGKHQSVSWMTNAVVGLYEALQSVNYTAEYHVYTEPVSAEYFSELLQHSTIVSNNVSIHFHTGTPPLVVFHRLITAPLLISSGSGFSTVAQMLRESPTLAYRPSCALTTMLDHQTGHFSQSDFLCTFNEWIAAGGQPSEWRRYESMQQCYNIQQWPQLDSFNPNATLASQGFSMTCGDDAAHR